MVRKYVIEAALRRKPKAAGQCTAGLTIPSVSEAVLDFSLLTAGGAVVYRRTRRPTSTCNAIAALAGIGQMQEAQ